MKKLFLICGLFSGTISVQAETLVQFVPDKPNNQVLDIKSAKLLSDDARVTLEGYIVGYAKTLDINEYIFTDNQDTIKIEIEPMVWRNQEVTPKTKIRITGELDRNDFNQTVEIEVDYLEIIN